MKITEWLEAQKKLLDDEPPNSWQINRDKLLMLIANQLDFLNNKFEGVRSNFTPHELQNADVILTTLEQTIEGSLALVCTEHGRALKIIEKMREALKWYQRNYYDPDAIDPYHSGPNKIFKEALAYFPGDDE